MDEEFKVFLSFAAGIGTREGREFWKDGASRTIQKNNRIRDEVLSGTKVMVRDDDGSFRETIAVKWDAENHDETIRKITRGLYWHHYHEILPLDTDIQVHFFPELSAELESIALRCTKKSVGGASRFAYCYTKRKQIDHVSIWLYQFYRGHYVGAFTGNCEQVLV